LSAAPSCLNQAPCKDYGNGLFGYSVNFVAADSSCREVCAAGTSLTSYLTAQNFKCGKCIRPSCPAQEPCRDYGNGVYAYKVNLVTADGNCKQICTAGNSLARYLFQGFTCGTCPPKVQPNCPNQNACQNFGGGVLGYSVSLVAADGSCKEVCAAGTSLVDLLNTNYKCGKCPPPLQPPGCPTQSPCKDFGNGLFGYSVSLVAADGSCKEACAAGTSLADLLKTDYKCGSCPPLSLPPGCPTETPCKDFGNGLLGYSISLVAADGSCKDVCAAGTSLTDLVHKTNYKCGQCTPPNLPSCPSINQCQEKGVGLMGYSVMKIAGNECAQYCATGADFTALLAEGFKCGKCPLPAVQDRRAAKTLVVVCWATLSTQLPQTVVAQTPVPPVLA
jgi:hypothetical protein